MKCESGLPGAAGPTKEAEEEETAAAFARQKPPHPLSNRPEIRQPGLRPGVFPVAVACWEMLVGMTNHFEKLV